MRTVIEQLRENKIPFGMWTPLMVETAKKIGAKFFLFYNGSSWTNADPDGGFDPRMAYMLYSQYECQHQEVHLHETKKCEVCDWCLSIVTANDEELLPCPFCGSEAHIDINGFARCQSMECAMGHHGIGKTHWNSRNHPKKQNQKQNLFLEFRPETWRHDADGRLVVEIPFVSI